MTTNTIRGAIMMGGLGWLLCGQAVEMRFTPVPVPSSPAEKTAIIATPSVSIDGVSHPIGYHAILRSGERAGDHVFGQLLDSQGKPITMADGSARLSNSNDFASLLNLPGGLFMVSHFEDRPGAMYLTELRQDADGLLSALRTRPIDFSSVKGGWVHCAGSMTPWQTHLGSEEYEPDARSIDPATGSIDDYYDAMAAYYAGDLLALNPYDYGWVTEVAVQNFDATTVTKHYAMGRVSVEMAKVMPDQRTVYISDDGTNVGLYLFHADKRGDLSAGDLYALQWQQTGSANGGQARAAWIALGHATNAEIAPLLAQRITFADLFDAAEPDGSGQCPAGFVSVNHGHDDGIHECLRLKPGMDQAASRLETRRYAAMMGATTELRKEEGLAFDPASKRLFIAMSEVDQGMEDNMRYGKPDNRYDIGGPNHVRLPMNRCGAVYGMSLGVNFNRGLLSGFVGKDISTVLSGRMTQALDPASSLVYDPAGPLAANRCDVEAIANPDNISFIPAANTLLVAEDSSYHENNMAWAHDLATGQLTRIQTAPLGAEITSFDYYQNVNGFGYLMSVIQHPFDDHEDAAPDEQARHAVTGYIGPFPALGK